MFMGAYGPIPIMPNGYLDPSYFEFTGDEMRELSPEERARKRKRPINHNGIVN